ncbi:MAG: hypothetical protein QM811_15720 [Pirellulales bacterium]
MRFRRIGRGPCAGRRSRLGRVAYRSFDRRTRRRRIRRARKSVEGIGRARQARHSGADPRRAAHSLEQVHRSVGVLERDLQSDDEALSEAAEEAFRQIAARSTTWAAQRAEVALGNVRALRQDATLEKFKTLGGEIIAEGSDLNGEPYLSLAIRRETWKGTEKDLRLLRNIPTMRQLSLFGAVVPANEWSKITDLKDLPHVESVRD